MAEDWDSYLAEYHEANPGITEMLFVEARDGAGRTPYDWLAEAVPPDTGLVVDLASGNGPVGRRLAPPVRVVAIDRSAGELRDGGGIRVQAGAGALPLAGGCAGTVVCSMALMLLHPLEATLAEVARLLGAGGTFVATVPVRATAATMPAFAGILRALGQVGVTYPAPLDAGLPDRFTAAGLSLHGDETAVFTRPVRTGEEAAQVVRSFYAPGAGARQVAMAIDILAAATPVDVQYRIRRLVARR